MDYRIEKDTLGEVQVPADKLWGAQTERSRNNFKIGQPASMPLDIIRGFAYLKKGAAFANHELGVLPVEKRDLIAAVCDEIQARRPVPSRDLADGLRYAEQYERQRSHR